MRGDAEFTPHEDLMGKLAIGHQEIDRIMDEVEQIFGSQPMDWLPVEPVGQMMLHEMYEDYDEFEDAVGGSFEGFLQILPQFEIRKNPDSGKTEFRVVPADPEAPPTILTLHVKERSDLWRVLYKSPEACVRIPHLEFEIGADSKRRIDSVYNHITHAVWNLSSHLRGKVGDAEATESALALSETVDALEGLLDVDEPFDIVIDDPTGASQFKPSDGVDVVEL
jgi:hypothetical protein